jgi:hypothetical protein
VLGKRVRRSVSRRYWVGDGFEVEAYTTPSDRAPIPTTGARSVGFRSSGKTSEELT